MDILVTYDVNTTTREGQVRLAHIAAICEKYGVRVQYSVFECRLTEKSLAKLTIELEDTLDLGLDSIHIYRFAGPIRDSRLVLGRARPRELGDPWIL